jgi:hypothetical protein
MFDGISNVLAAWREVVHISEWTGLSIGALATIAFVVYLDPRILKPALVVAIVILLVYFGVLYGDKVGRADVNVQWADARAAAEIARKKRDAEIELKLEAKYQPQLEDLQKQADERKARADAYEAKIARLSKRQGAVACLLGDAANRVRRK